MTDAMKPLIYAASEGPLSRAQAEAAFEELFEGTATPAQIGGLLMAMRARGESVRIRAAGSDARQVRQRHGLRERWTFGRTGRPAKDGKTQL